MDSYQSPRKRKTRARERYEARRRRRQAAAQRRSSVERPLDVGNHVRAAGGSWLDRLREVDWVAIMDRARVALMDLGWHLRRRPILVYAALGLVLLLIVWHYAGSLLSGRIMPGVQAMGVDLGGERVSTATEKLNATWAEDDRIRVMVEGEVFVEVAAADLGIGLDAERTARRARDVGLGAVPFGDSVRPVVTFDYLVAQTFLLDLSAAVNERPQNGRFALENGVVVPIDGKMGRQLDTTSTLQYLERHLERVVDRGQLDLLILPVEPVRVDPATYVADVQALISQPIALNGYDPFTNQTFTWPMDAETVVNWLAAGPAALVLRDEVFTPFIDRLNETLNPEGGTERYLAPDETRQLVEQSLAFGETDIMLRVRYRPTTYEVQPGDSAFAIARRFGIPFFMLRDANSGRNLDILSIGDQLNIPSPDEVLPEPVVPQKRIVVDLDAQYMIAYENGAVVFEWPISSGVDNAPTSPGVYQILNREEVTWGSSSTLCDSAGVVCGEWEMYWFMGIYEVSPGLVNGFHGRVLLPNGNTLGDSLIGIPATFGCVMSSDDEAQQLYQWADVGTIVEIVSSEYPPRSDLARITVQQTGSNL